MKKRITFQSSRLEEPLLAASEDILDVSEKLNAMLKTNTARDQQTEFTETLFEEDFQKMVIATSTVVRLGEEWFNLGDDDVVIGLIVPLAKKVRKSVLNYVPATKAAFSNSMDYLTKNAQAQSFRMVDKYTRALCAIVEILHRKRIRSSGISFGTIDAMDSDCVLLIKIANNLAAESRQIITLAQQGDPLEILTSSEGFLRAMEDFIDNISRYKLPVTKELVKRLRSQHQAIIVLSQDAKRMKEGSGQLSKDDIDERGASISTQVVNCTIELVLMIVMYYQKQWQDLIDAPIENTEDIESSENDSGGPRKPQKPNQSKVGKELPFFPTDSLGKRRSVRIDYERKYGLKPSYNSNSLAATVDSEKARLRKYSHSVSVVRDSEKEKGSQSPSDNQMKSSRAHTESSPLGKSEESSSLFRSKRSSEPAVQKMSLNPFKGKSKKKRRSASIRLRSNSDSVKKGEIISVHYVEATAEAEEKLNALFRDPTPFLSQEKSSPVEENSPRSNISKKRSKKRQMHGKSLPTKESTMYLRSAPSYLDAMDESCGGPQSVFRTTTTFVPKIERISSKKKLNKTGLFCDVSESDDSQGSPKKSARRVTLEEPIHPKSKAAQRRSTIIVDPPELLPEEISPAETEHKKQIAMAAAMAASVPVVIDLFQKEFSWFSKEWDRLPMTSKTKFTTKMRNELIKMNNFVPPTIIEQSAQKHYIDSKSLKRQASFIPLNSLLSQIKEKKEQDDLEGMMVPLSSKVRWFHRSASLSNFLTKENAAKLQESQKLILEVVQACTNLIEDFINVKAPIREKPPKFLASKIVDIYKVLSSIVTLSTGSADNKIVRQMIVPTLDLISASPTQGTADDYLVNKLKSSNTYSQVLVTLTILRMNIYQKLQNIACMSAQVSHTINCVDYTLKKISHTNTLQLLSCTRAMTTTICEMLNVIETYSLIRFTFTEEKCGKLEKVKSVKGLNRIWTHKSSSDESISLCTLDYFITELTNPFNNTPERKEYELSFILTFQTTCSSQVLYEKLMNRYNVPDNIQASADEISATQKLVCHFILLWIQLQFSEISKVAVGQLLEKTKIFTKDGHTLLADSIERTIQQKLSEENRATSLSLKITPPDIQTLTCGMNLYQCFLQTSERKIAEQLTLMDFNIFKEIHHSELIDQAWIRNRHSAVHVMDHITRLNHVSYWVPSLILWSEKVKQRGEVLWKFIQIGQELLKLHNYNTLMGLVAGLNMSCITRLKHTTNMLPKNQIQIMQDLIHLFNPSRSFHVYRDHIEKAERPVIPYLGVYLTDLTLIDEIHSNKEDNLINFGKRRLIGDILQKILYFQEIPYDIEPDDFLSSYLRDLSFLDDEGLYQLSLTREPRNAEMFDIL